MMQSNKSRRRVVAGLLGLFVMGAAPLALSENYGTFQQWHLGYQFSFDEDDNSPPMYPAAGNAIRHLRWTKVNKVKLNDSYGVRYRGSPQVVEFLVLTDCSWFFSVACPELFVTSNREERRSDEMESSVGDLGSIGHSTCFSWVVLARCRSGSITSGEHDSFS